MLAAAIDSFMGLMQIAEVRCTHAGRVIQQVHQFTLSSCTCSARFEASSGSWPDCMSTLLASWTCTQGPRQTDEQAVLRSKTVVLDLCLTMPTELGMLNMQAAVWQSSPGHGFPP